MPVALWNSEQARLMGIKSGEARRAKPVQFPVQVQPNPLFTEPNIARTVSERLKLLAEQIRNAREILNAEPQQFCSECGQGGHMPIHHRAALMRALDNLIEREQDLLGIPGRGQRKPGNEAKPRHIPAEPIDPPS